jgi:Kdo2-lipid IVA lauroyltransferase/acyltransferase
MRETDRLNRIIPGLIWLILWILSWLPGFILKFLSHLINAVTFVFFQYRSEVVKANLKRSFPELNTLAQNKIAEEFYRHFSEIFTEMILFIRLRPRKDSRRIRFSDSQLIDDAFRQKQNIIIIAGHYGNWEWNLLPILASGYRVLAVYKPQSSAGADILMQKIRQKPGITLVSMKDTLRVIAQEQKDVTSPFALLLVADQIPARGDIRFWTTFLNQETAFFTGGEKLGQKFGLPVFYADQEKKGFGHYLVRLSLLYDGVSESQPGDITRKFAALLEESIRKVPYLWLWTHRRWKYHREELPLHT